MQRREISVVLDGRMRGSWPVAIGDTKTPMPQGQFSNLKKNKPHLRFQKVRTKQGAHWPDESNW